MKTQSQLRSTVYNALLNSTAITNNIYWLSRPTVSNQFPCITYGVLDTTGSYAFCGKQSELFQIQIDLYCDPSEITAMDTQFEGIKTAMEGAGYRLISSPAEFLEADINKIVRASRWEVVNV